MIARKTAAPLAATSPETAGPDLKDYPVREYVAAMAAELAGMAREDGDRLLAQALDVAAQLARRPA